jgi:predicted DNA-binding protein
MMHRTQIYIPEHDIEKLRYMKETTGKSVGEIVRGIISEYLENLDRKEKKAKKNLMAILGK